MAYPTRYYRLYNFLLDQLRNLTFNNGKLDAELSGVQATLDQINTTLRGITNADGTLRNVASATALVLAGAQRFSATASQTVFDCSDSTFSANSVIVFSGGTRLDSSAVTVADNSGFLRVTIAAQSLGTIVIVDAFQPGFAAAAASTVTVADAGGYFTATNVEDVLQEIENDATYGIRTLIAALPGGSIAGLADFLNKDGSVAMTGALDMSGGSGMGYVSANGEKIVGLAGGTEAGDAVEWSQFSAFTTVWNNLATYFLKLDGTSVMAGTLNMGNQWISDVKDADQSQAAQAANVGTVRSMISSNAGLPVGTITFYGGNTTAPNGWLLCDGSEVAQATYPSLFAVIGSTYGTAGAGNFKVPDLRGRAPIGVGTGDGGGTSGSGTVTGGTALTARVVGAWGGEETHVLTVPEMPSHSHTMSKDNTSTTGSTSVLEVDNTTGTRSTDSTGGGGAHQNMVPFMVLSAIIKAS